MSTRSKRTGSLSSKKATPPFAWWPRALLPAKTWANPWKLLTPATLLLTHWPGDDAGHFGIESETGQILTKDPLDYDAQGSYLVTVQVTDGADDGGAEDTSIDDTIEVTIRVSVTIDLNDWTAEDYETNTQYCASGTWAVDSNGRAKETRGQAPSILSRRFRRLRQTPHCPPFNPGKRRRFLRIRGRLQQRRLDQCGRPTTCSSTGSRSRRTSTSGGDSTSAGGSAERLV